jgi:hypothetical protein
VHLIDGQGFTFIGEFPPIASKTSIGVARPWMVLHSDVHSPRKLMPALGVRREKAALSSGCKPHPATAPAGSNRSNYGGNEMVEAFG